MNSTTPELIFNKFIASLKKQRNLDRSRKYRDRHFDKVSFLQNIGIFCPILNRLEAQGFNLDALAVGVDLDLDLTVDRLEQQKQTVKEQEKHWNDVSSILETMLPEILAGRNYPENAYYPLQQLEALLVKHQNLQTETVRDQRGRKSVKRSIIDGDDFDPTQMLTEDDIDVLLPTLGFVNREIKYTFLTSVTLAETIKQYMKDEQGNPETYHIPILLNDATDERGQDRGIHWRCALVTVHAGEPRTITAKVVDSSALGDQTKREIAEVVNNALTAALAQVVADPTLTVRYEGYTIPADAVTVESRNQNAKGNACLDFALYNLLLMYCPNSQDGGIRALFAASVDGRQPESSVLRRLVLEKLLNNLTISREMLYGDPRPEAHVRMRRSQVHADIQGEFEEITEGPSSGRYKLKADYINTLMASMGPAELDFKEFAELQQALSSQTAGAPVFSLSRKVLQERVETNGKLLGYQTEYTDKLKDSLKVEARVVEIDVSKYFQTKEQVRCFGSAEFFAAIQAISNDPDCRQIKFKNLGLLRVARDDFWQEFLRALFSLKNITRVIHPGWNNQKYYNDVRAFEIANKIALADYSLPEAIPVTVLPPATAAAPEQGADFDGAVVQPVPVAKSAKELYMETLETLTLTSDASGPAVEESNDDYGVIYEAGNVTTNILPVVESVASVDTAANTPTPTPAAQQSVSFEVSLPKYISKNDDLNTCLAKLQLLIGKINLLTSGNPIVVTLVDWQRAFSEKVQQDPKLQMILTKLNNNIRFGDNGPQRDEFLPIINEIIGSRRKGLQYSLSELNVSPCSRAATIDFTGYLGNVESEWALRTKALIHVINNGQPVVDNAKTPYRTLTFTNVTEQQRLPLETVIRGLTTVTAFKIESPGSVQTIKSAPEAISLAMSLRNQALEFLNITAENSEAAWREYFVARLNQAFGQERSRDQETLHLMIDGFLSDEPLSGFDKFTFNERLVNCASEFLRGFLSACDTLQGINNFPVKQLSFTVPYNYISFSGFSAIEQHEQYNCEILRELVNHLNTGRHFSFQSIQLGLPVHSATAPHVSAEFINALKKLLLALNNQKKSVTVSISNQRGVQKFSKGQLKDLLSFYNDNKIAVELDIVSDVLEVDNGDSYIKILNAIAVHKRAAQAKNYVLPVGQAVVDDVQAGMLAVAEVLPDASIRPVKLIVNPEFNVEVNVEVGAAVDTQAETSTAAADDEYFMGAPAVSGAVAAINPDIDPDSLITRENILERETISNFLLSYQKRARINIESPQSLKIISGRVYDDSYDSSTDSTSTEKFRNQSAKSLPLSEYVVKRLLSPRGSGQFSQTVHALTPIAFEAVMANQTVFEGTLDLDNPLPEGFFAVEYKADGQIKIYLDYDASRVNVNVTPLTQTLSKQQPYQFTGDVNQFLTEEQLRGYLIKFPHEMALGCTPSNAFGWLKESISSRGNVPVLDFVKRASFDFIVTAMGDALTVQEPNKQYLAESIIKNLDNLLDVFAEQSYPLKALFTVLHFAGLEGLYAFLDALNTLQIENKPVFDGFVKNFIDITDINSLAHLSTPESIDVLKALSKPTFTEAQSNWWNALLSHHFQFDEDKYSATGHHTGFVELFNGFQYFCRVLDNVNPRLILPRNFPQIGDDNCPNMMVFLARVLTILEKTAPHYKQQQLDNLSGLDFSNQGAAYAAVKNGYRFVHSSMRLEPDFDSELITTGAINNTNYPAFYAIVRQENDFLDYQEKIVKSKENMRLLTQLGKTYKLKLEILYKERQSLASQFEAYKENISHPYRVNYAILKNMVKFSCELINSCGSNQSNTGVLFFRYLGSTPDLIHVRDFSKYIELQQKLGANTDHSAQVKRFYIDLHAIAAIATTVTAKTGLEPTDFNSTEFFKFLNTFDFKHSVDGGSYADAENYGRNIHPVNLFIVELFEDAKLVKPTLDGMTGLLRWLYNIHALEHSSAFDYIKANAGADLWSVLGQWNNNPNRVSASAMISVCTAITNSKDIAKIMAEELAELKAMARSDVQEDDLGVATLPDDEVLEAKKELYFTEVLSFVSKICIDSRLVSAQSGEANDQVAAIVMSLYAHPLAVHIIEHMRQIKLNEIDADRLSPVSLSTMLNEIADIDNVSQLKRLLKEKLPSNKKAASEETVNVVVEESVKAPQSQLKQQLVELLDSSLPKMLEAFKILGVDPKLLQGLTIEQGLTAQNVKQRLIEKLAALYSAKVKITLPEEKEEKKKGFSLKGIVQSVALVAVNASSQTIRDLCKATVDEDSGSIAGSIVLKGLAESGSSSLKTLANVNEFLEAAFKDIIKGILKPDAIRKIVTNLFGPLPALPPLDQLDTTLSDFVDYFEKIEPLLPALTALTAEWQAELATKTDLKQLESLDVNLLAQLLALLPKFSVDTALKRVFLQNPTLTDVAAIKKFRHAMNIIAEALTSNGVQYSAVIYQALFTNPALKNIDQMETFARNVAFFLKNSASLKEALEDVTLIAANSNLDLGAYISLKRRISEKQPALANKISPMIRALVQTGEMNGVEIVDAFAWIDSFPNGSDLVESVLTLSQNKPEDMIALVNIAREKHFDLKSYLSALFYTKEIEIDAKGERKLISLTEGDLTAISFSLDKLSSDQFKVLADLYKTKPYPHFAKLQEILALYDNQAKFDRVIAAYDRDPSGLFDLDDQGNYRDPAKIKEAYEYELVTQMPRILDEFRVIDAKGRQRALFATEKTELVARLVYMNDLSRNTYAPMTAEQLKQAFLALKTEFRFSAVGSTERERITLKILAALREVYRRTSTKNIVAHLVQLLPLLLSTEGNTFVQVKTGEGKTAITALEAVMKHVLGGPVIVTTSDNILAQKGKDENEAFFEYLGIKGGLISDASGIEDLNQEGIHYGELAGVALFLQNHELKLNKDINMTLHLVADELDHATASRAKFRLARSLSGAPEVKPQVERAYVAIFDFVNNDNLFLQQRVTPEKDIENLKKYVRESKVAAHVRSTISSFSDKHLSELIDDAFIIAKAVYAKPNEKFELHTVKREPQDGLDVATFFLDARVLDDGRAQSNKARFSGYGHAMLHAVIAHSFDGKKDAFYKNHIIPYLEKFPEKFARDYPNERVPEISEIQRPRVEPVSHTLSQANANALMLRYARQGNGSDIFGLTGTLESNHLAALCEQMGAHAYIIPKFKPPKMEIKPTIVAYVNPPVIAAVSQLSLLDRVFRTFRRVPEPVVAPMLQLPTKQEADDVHITKLVKIALAETANGRPVLLYAEEDEYAAKIKSALEKAIVDLSVADQPIVQDYVKEQGETPAVRKVFEDGIVAKAGKPKTITITKLLARGTDIEPEENKLLVVIDSSLRNESDERGSWQLWGRTDRQGKGGIVYKVYSEWEYISRGLPVPRTHEEADETNRLIRIMIATHDDPNWFIDNRPQEVFTQIQDAFINLMSKLMHVLKVNYHNMGCDAEIEQHWNQRIQPKIWERWADYYKTIEDIWNKKAGDIRAYLDEFRKQEEVKLKTQYPHDPKTVASKLNLLVAQHVQTTIDAMLQKFVGEAKGHLWDDLCNDMLEVANEVYVRSYTNYVDQLSEKREQAVEPIAKLTREIQGCDREIKRLRGQIEKQDAQHEQVLKDLAEGENGSAVSAEQIERERVENELKNLRAQLQQLPNTYDGIIAEKNYLLTEAASALAMAQLTLASQQPKGFFASFKKAFASDTPEIADLKAKKSTAEKELLTAEGKKSRAAAEFGRQIEAKERELEKANKAGLVAQVTANIARGNTVQAFRAGHEDQLQGLMASIVKVQERKDHFLKKLSDSHQAIELAPEYVVAEELTLAQLKLEDRSAEVVAKPANLARADKALVTNFSTKVAIPTVAQAKVMIEESQDSAVKQQAFVDFLIPFVKEQKLYVVGIDKERFILDTIKAGLNKLLKSSAATINPLTLAAIKRQYWSLLEAVKLYGDQAAKQVVYDAHVSFIRELPAMMQREIEIARAREPRVETDGMFDYASEMDAQAEINEVTRYYYCLQENTVRLLYELGDNNQGFLPAGADLSKGAFFYEQDGAKKLWDELLEYTLHEIAMYKDTWWKSRDRDAFVKELEDTLADRDGFEFYTKPEADPIRKIKVLMGKLNELSLEAAQKDYEKDSKRSWFSFRNRNGGSRFQKMLARVRDRAISSLSTDEQVYQAQVGSIQTIITEIAKYGALPLFTKNPNETITDILGLLTLGVKASTNIESYKNLLELKDNLNVQLSKLNPETLDKNQQGFYHALVDLVDRITRLEAAVSVSSMRGTLTNDPDVMVKQAIQAIAGTQALDADENFCRYIEDRYHDVKFDNLSELQIKRAYQLLYALESTTLKARPNAKFKGKSVILDPNSMLVVQYDLMTKDQNNLYRTECGLVVDGFSQRNNVCHFPKMDQRSEVLQEKKKSTQGMLDGLQVPRGSEVAVDKNLEKLLIAIIHEYKALGIEPQDDGSRKSNMAKVKELATGHVEQLAKVYLRLESAFSDIKRTILGNEQLRNLFINETVNIPVFARHLTVLKERAAPAGTEPRPRANSASYFSFAAHRDEIAKQSKEDTSTPNNVEPIRKEGPKVS